MAEGSNFENVCSSSISATNYPISMKYCTPYASFDFDSGHKKVTAVTAKVAADGRHVKNNRFTAIPQRHMQLRISYFAKI